jgi:indole-3-glycerol phosphate synthase
LRRSKERDAVSILDEIANHKRAEVAQRRAALPHPGSRPAPARDFAAALRGDGVAIIAEFKRRSPSRGVITDRWSPAELAAVYESGDAAAISVLTDERYFGGSLDDLREARAACSIPVLRKDFIIDEWQIEETAAAGADAVLLIVAVLGKELDRMLQAAGEFGLAALVEVHTEEQAARALDAGAEIIGINNRDLATFVVGPVWGLIAPLIPSDRIVVSESGIKTADHVRALAERGVDAALVGEALMTAANPAAFLGELVAAGKEQPAAPSRPGEGRRRGR